MDLARELRALELDWPETPPLRLELEPRRGRRRLLAAAALGAAALSVAAAFAVPQSRGAILRFLHLGGVTIRFVDRLPSVQERPLSADLGPVATPAEAAGALGRRPLLPRLATPPPLHLRNRVVSVVFTLRGEPVLLSEFAFGPYAVKKLVGGATSVTPVRIGASEGFWLSRAEHAVSFTAVPPRLAGNVLLWQRGDLTLRLEGRRLTQKDALDLAESIYPGMG
jgi:hypothetical protein